MRIIAVSATLPNIADIAGFIEASEAFVFDDSYRPVPLTKHVRGFGKVAKNEFKFWSSLDRHVPEIIARFSSNKQTLVFCHSKKETEKLACYILQTMRSNQTSQSKTLHEFIAEGVAYHHAGLDVTQRKLVEQEFASGRLRVLCATSTLAVGVNLPAHLVIVKGTMTWRGGGAGYQEIDATTLCQMIGRAGRPGLDTSGIAVIMTDDESKSRIERLAFGVGAAESQLISKLVEVINTEISQRVIISVEGAIAWMKTSFFFTQKLHSSYNKQGESKLGDSDDLLLNLSVHAIQQLKDISLVEETVDGELKPLPAGHIMSQNMVPFQATKLIASLPFDATQKQILKIISQVDELSTFPLRRNEKACLNQCHKSELIKHKISIPAGKYRVQGPSDKTFILLQASIAQHEFENFTLRQEMSALVDQACRFLSAAEEFSIFASKNGQVALQSMKLRRSLQVGLRGEASGLLHQIEGVSQACAAKLSFNGIVSFEDAMSSTAEKLEIAAGRSAPFGKQVREKIAELFQAKLQISASIEYTRGSNIPAEVLCHIIPPARLSDEIKNISTSSRTDPKPVNYCLVSKAPIKCG